jgi:hypothetical protein
VWDISSAKCVATILGHRQEVWTVAVSLDDKHIISGCNDKTVCLWPMSDYPADGEPASPDAARTSGGSVKAAEPDASAHASHADASVTAASSAQTLQGAASIAAVDQDANPMDQLDQMTWLPADAFVRCDLAHADLWQVMSELTIEEWREDYDIKSIARIRRLKQVVDLAIAWRKQHE